MPSEEIQRIQEFLDKASKCYYDGHPIIEDSEFDFLANKYGYEKVGSKVASPEKGRHYFRLYSLQKIYDDESPPCKAEVESLKLDGAAISLLYIHGYLIKALTRGDGITGKDCTDQVMASGMVPTKINIKEIVQIAGEVVLPRETENARNLASGTLGLLDLDEVKRRQLTFVAYSFQPAKSETYIEDMTILHNAGFLTVLDDSKVLEKFPTDGKVYRINNNKEYIRLGYTEKHPRGAYALKLSSDVAVEETVLRDVTWQVGSSGKVTPVAHFDEVVIGDAKITKSTLHNLGIIKEMDLDIGDTILVTRRGGIIPQIIGKL